VGACGLLWQSHQRQEALNRQLITALVNQDPKQALALVNAGADPNTPFQPPSPPSLKQLWNHLVHHTALPRKDTRSALFLACGAISFNEPDDPQLVETMLQHGAQKNAKDGYGGTPLLWSIVAMRPKTVEILLNYGVDVNAHDSTAGTALCWVIMLANRAYLPEQSKDANLVRKLLAHGADPNLPDRNGKTPLQIARDVSRPDLVVLLKQAGVRSKDVTLHLWCSRRRGLPSVKTLPKANPLYPCRQLRQPHHLDEKPEQPRR
jgi:ankyrin repeat protein